MIQQSCFVILESENPFSFLVLPLDGSKDDSQQGLDTTRTGGFYAKPPGVRGPDPATFHEYKKSPQASSQSSTSTRGRELLSSLESHSLLTLGPAGVLPTLRGLPTFVAPSLPQVYLAFSHLHIP